jgi:hypothetical protein
MLLHKKRVVNNLSILGTQILLVSMSQRWGVRHLILQRINTCLLNQVFIRIYRNALLFSSNKQTQVFGSNELS